MQEKQWKKQIDWTVTMIPFAIIVVLCLAFVAFPRTV